jgi:hypothetical protein
MRRKYLGLKNRAEVTDVRKHVVGERSMGAEGIP